jgi:glycosyltransferase involved in cell wall biosynthesis
VHSEGIWPFPPLRDYADAAGIPLIVTVHNLEHVVAARSGRARVLAHFLRRLEGRTYSRADLLVCMSANDKDYMRRRMGVSPDHIVVVPNGATPPEIDSDPEALRSMLGLKGPVVLFMGKLDYRPNAEALEFLLEGVLPRIRKDLPRATLVVVGSPEPPRMPPGALAVGGVPSVWPYVLSSDVCVAPLLSGSGTRLKVLEYMAAGRPVVSTAIGVEGLEVEAGRDLVLAETPGDFAGEVVRLLRDPSEAAALARRGRDLVDRLYRWDAIAQRYEEELSQYLGTRRWTRE